MNTQLEKLFSQHNLSQKDRYEIRQMYSLLPNHKQRGLIENFAVLAAKFKQIEEDIQVQRELLVGNAIGEIEKTIEKVKLDLQINKSNSDLEDLKSQL